jgi:hypothetical protein
MGWLKGLVIFMGVLIVLGTGVLIYTLATRGAKMAAGTTPMSPSVSAPATGGFGRAVLDVGPGCEIATSHADSGRLILRVDGPGACRKILVLDPATGAVTGQLDIVPAK